MSERSGVNHEQRRVEMSDELFPYPIPVVVVTGEYESGKTLASLTTGYDLDRTLIFDNEQSSAVYQANFAFHRVDIAAEVAKAKGTGWTNEDFYLAWAEYVKKMPPDRYDVIGIDTVERIESGLADYIWKNPINGHQASQYARMTGMYWGDVKDQWGRHILELTAKCKMVILTVHMRNVYQGKAPVPGKRERKGKDTLSELATLEIELIRKPGMTAPAAKVIKTRLVYGKSPSDIKPMFDPYINPFTWEHVREYMRKGVDLDNIVLPPEPTEEEKRLRELELEATIAAAKLAGTTSGDESEEVGGTTDSKCPECGAGVAPHKPGHRPGCSFG